MTTTEPQPIDFVDDPDNFGELGCSRFPDFEAVGMKFTAPKFCIGGGYFVDASEFAKAAVVHGESLRDYFMTLDSVRGYDQYRLPAYRGTIKLVNCGKTVGFNSAAQALTLIELDAAKSIVDVTAEPCEVYGTDKLGEPLAAIPHYLVRASGGDIVALDVYPLHGQTNYMHEKQELLLRVFVPLGIQVGISPEPGAIRRFR